MKWSLLLLVLFASAGRSQVMQKTVLSRSMIADVYAKTQLLRNGGNVVDSPRIVDPPHVYSEDLIPATLVAAQTTTEPVPGHTQKVQTDNILSFKEDTAGAGIRVGGRWFSRQILDLVAWPLSASGNPQILHAVSLYAGTGRKQCTYILTDPFANNAYQTTRYQIDFECDFDEEVNPPIGSGPHLQMSQRFRVGIDGDETAPQFLQFTWHRNHQNNDGTRGAWYREGTIKMLLDPKIPPYDYNLVYIGLVPTWLAGMNQPIYKAQTYSRVPKNGLHTMYAEVSYVPDPTLDVSWKTHASTATAVHPQPIPADPETEHLERDDKIDVFINVTEIQTWNH